MTRDIQYYVTARGACPVRSWLAEMQDLKAKVAVVRRIDRLVPGNFGDHKFVGSGVWELRIDVGPGYRLYYGHMGSAAVLLLCGGSKRTQDQDIRKALEYWADYWRRTR